jgi:hypothetical protein
MQSCASGILALCRSCVNYPLSEAHQVQAVSPTYLQPLYICLTHPISCLPLTQIWILEKNGGSLVGGAIKLFQERGKNPGPPRDPRLPPKPKAGGVEGGVGGRGACTALIVIIFSWSMRL